MVRVVFGGSKGEYVSVVVRVWGCLCGPILLCWLINRDASPASPVQNPARCTICPDLPLSAILAQQQPGLCVSVCVCACVSVCCCNQGILCVCVCVGVNVYIRLNMCIYMCVCVCAYACVCVRTCKTLGLFLTVHVVQRWEWAKLVLPVCDVPREVKERSVNWVWKQGLPEHQNIIIPDLIINNPVKST